jgi:hypothetical protein
MSVKCFAMVDQASGLNHNIKIEGWNLGLFLFHFGFAFETVNYQIPLIEEFVTLDEICENMFYTHCTQETQTVILGIRYHFCSRI